MEKLDFPVVLEDEMIEIQAKQAIYHREMVFAVPHSLVLTSKKCR